MAFLLCLSIGGSALHKTEYEQQAILGIALLAAFADGHKADAEREAIAATARLAEAQAAVGRSMPLQRMGAGEDIAGAVLWLCSSLAAWVSGARINVDGGGERPYFLDLVKGE